MTYIILGNGRVVPRHTYVTQHRNIGFSWIDPDARSSVNEYRDRRVRRQWESKYNHAARHIRRLYEENPHNVEELAAAALSRITGETYTPEFEPSQPNAASACVLANMLRAHGDYEVEVDYNYIYRNRESIELRAAGGDGVTLAGIAAAFDKGYLPMWAWED